MGGKLEWQQWTTCISCEWWEILGHHNDPLSKLQTIVIQESIQSLISQMKSECLGKF